MSFSDEIQWPRAVTARRKLGTVPACPAQRHEWLILSVATTSGHKPLIEVCTTCGHTPPEVLGIMVEAEAEREAAEQASERAADKAAAKPKPKAEPEPELVTA